MPLRRAATTLLGRTNPYFDGTNAVGVRVQSAVAGGRKHKSIAKRQS